MKLGALLVLVGVILVVVDFALSHLSSPRASAGLLHAGVILIGLGALLGHTQLTAVH
jgi:uncharacterized membrane protein